MNIDRSNSYISQVHQIPILDTEEEYRLARQYQQHNDINAIQTLIYHNLRYVISLANDMNGYHLPFMDLIQEGNIGLMKAAKNYDPDKSSRLCTYAAMYIKHEMYNYVMSNVHPLKLVSSKNQKKLFFEMRSKVSNTMALSNDDIQRIASELDVSENEVKEMELRLTNNFVNTYNSNGEAIDITSDGILPDENYELLNNDDIVKYNMDILRRECNNLDERNRSIVEKRLLTEPPIQGKVIAKELNISHQRVEQICKNFKNKVKPLLKNSS